MLDAGDGVRSHASGKKLVERRNLEFYMSPMGRKPMCIAPRVCLSGQSGTSRMGSGAVNGRAEAKAISHCIARKPRLPHFENVPIGILIWKL